MSGVGHVVINRLLSVNAWSGDFLTSSRVGSFNSPLISVMRLRVNKQFFHKQHSMEHFPRFAIFSEQAATRGLL